MCTVEEVLDFKGVFEDKKMSLVEKKLHGRAIAWWQQLKLNRTRLGKMKITSWEKMNKHLCTTFLPYNYQRVKH